MKLTYLIICILMVYAFVSCTDDDTFKEEVIDFEEFHMLPEMHYHSNSDYIQSGSLTFPNYYRNDSEWEGFTISNRKDVVSVGIENQYSVVRGGGWDATDYYAVVRCPEGTSIMCDSVNGTEIRGLFITNSTWNYYSMMYGYQDEKKFGGLSGSDPDWFKVTIRAIALSGRIIGEIDFYLADYRFDDDSKDYVIGEWNYIDLSDFGIVKRLEFKLSSSDINNNEMVTPPYFCIDHIRTRIHN